MFTYRHFIWLGIFAVLIPLAIILLKKFKIPEKKVSLVVLALAIILRLIHVAGNMVPIEGGVGMVFDPTKLPFQLCSYQVYLFLIINLTKNEKVISTVKSFIVPSAIIGAMLALLIPTGGVAFNEVGVWEYMLAHSLFVFYGFYLMFVEKVDLGLKSYAKNLGLLSAVVVIAFIGNSVLQEYDVNFCFLVRPPVEKLPILNLNHGWYVYFLTLVIIAVVLILLLQLPFIIKEMLNKKKLKK